MIFTISKSGAGPITIWADCLAYVLPLYTNDATGEVGAFQKVQNGSLLLCIGMLASGLLGASIGLVMGLSWQLPDGSFFVAVHSTEKSQSPPCNVHKTSRGIVTVCLKHMVHPTLPWRGLG